VAAHTKCAAPLTVFRFPSLPLVIHSLVLVVRGDPVV